VLKQRGRLEGKGKMSNEERKEGGEYGGRGGGDGPVGIFNWARLKRLPEEVGWWMKGERTTRQTERGAWIPYYQEKELEKVRRKVKEEGISPSRCGSVEAPKASKCKG